MSATPEPALRTALADVLALVEDGLLVRDSSRDDDALRFVLDGMRLVRVLAEARRLVDGTGPPA
jgi:hypothetical protein